MFSDRLFSVVGLVWFFGWGFLSLKYPVQSYRVLSWGRTPTPKQPKLVRFVGYIGVGFDSFVMVLLLEIASGMIR
jgi:hypothetical protein